MELSEIKIKLEEMVPSFAAKVQPIYALLKWEWSPPNTTPHIPSVGEIERTLYESIGGLTGEYYKCGSGGLCAFYEMPDNKEPGDYGLIFELEERVSFD